MKRKEAFFLFLVILFSFLIRLKGITWGLPNTYHPDEPYMLDFTHNMINDNWNPTKFNNRPFVYGPVLMGIVAIIGKILIFFSSILKIELPKIYNLIFLGRLIVAIFAAINTYFVYKFCKVFSNENSALLASLFFSLSYSHIIHSHYYTTDVPLTFFITLCLFFLYKIQQEPIFQLKYYILTGLFAALAFSTKFTAAFLMFPTIALFFSMNLFSKTEIDLKKMKKFFLLIIIGISCTLLLLNYFFNPLTNIKSAYKQLIKNALGERVSEWGCSYPNNLLFYSSTLFVYFKPFLGIIIFPALLFFILKYKKDSFVLVSFIVPFFMIHCLMRNFSDRYLLPMVPFFSIILGISINNYVEYFWKKGIIKYFLLSLLIIQLMISLFYALRIDYIFSLTDTRILASEWINLFIPEQSKIAAEIQGPRVKLNRLKVAWLYQKPMDFYKKREVDYFIISNSLDPFLMNFMNCNARKIFYDDLRKNNLNLKRFSLEKIGFTNPEIEIVQASWSKNIKRFLYTVQPKFELCKNKIIILKDNLNDECLGGFYISQDGIQKILLSHLPLKKIKIYLVNQKSLPSIVRIRNSYHIREVKLKPFEKKLIDFEVFLSFPYIKYLYEIKIRSDNNSKVYCKIILDELNESLHLWNLGHIKLAIEKINEVLKKEEDNLLARYYHSLYLYNSGNKKKAEEIIENISSDFILASIIFKKIKYFPQQKIIKIVLNPVAVGYYNLILNAYAAEQLGAEATIQSEMEYSFPIKFYKGQNELTFPIKISHITNINVILKTKEVKKIKINNVNLLLDKEKMIDYMKAAAEFSIFPRNF